MSCYFRHLKDIMQEAGIEVTPQNKRQVDEAIHRIMSVDYKNCSATWKALKKRVAGEPTRRDLVHKLQDALRS